MVKINSIYYKTINGEEIYPNKIHLLFGIGIKEDNYSGRNGRHLCFIFHKDLIKLNEVKGLCIKRFKANIIIDKYKNISVGDKLIIEDALVEVTKVGKRCFDICSIPPNERKYCTLKNVLFGEVLKGGLIKKGSNIIVEKSSL